MKVLRLVIISSLVVSLFAAESQKPKTTPEAEKVTQAPAPITVTVGQLWSIAATGVLDKLAAADLPIAAAFRLHGIIDALSPHIQRAVKVKATAFTDDNSTADSNGNRFPKAGKMDELQKTLEPLAAEKVTIIVEPIVVEDDLPGVKLNANDIGALGPLIKQKGK